MDMEKAFEMVENLTEELGEKETKIIKLEKELITRKRINQKTEMRLEIFEVVNPYYQAECYDPDGYDLKYIIEYVEGKFEYHSWRQLSLEIIFDKLNLGNGMGALAEKRRFMPIWELRECVVDHIESILDTHFDLSEDEIDEMPLSDQIRDAKEFLEHKKSSLECDFGCEKDCFGDCEESMLEIYYDNTFLENEIFDGEKFEVVDCKFENDEGEKMYLFVDAIDYTPLN
jgi:hypothetical protein